MRVERLSREDGGFRVQTRNRCLCADQVVVAMADYQVPWRPDFAEELRPQVFQLHSKHYRHPEQLRAGSVLVVGGGNSAADIALELSATHDIWMAGKETGHIPFRIEPWLARHFLISLVRIVGHFVLCAAILLDAGRAVNCCTRRVPWFGSSPRTWSTRAFVGSTG